MSRLHRIHAGAAALSDERLLEQVAVGSEAAFEEIYDRYCDRAYRLAWAVCRDAGRAEDAVQDAFSCVWRRASTFASERGSGRAWLLATVRHRAVDGLRRDARHRSRRAEEGALAAVRTREGLDHDVIEREGASALVDRLQRLPEAQREVITLAYFGQLTHSEIAAHLQLPSGTVKGRMRLGLRRLEAELDGEQLVGSDL